MLGDTLNNDNTNVLSCENIDYRLYYNLLGHTLNNDNTNLLSCENIVWWFVGIYLKQQL